MIKIDAEQAMDYSINYEGKQAEQSILDDTPRAQLIQKRQVGEAPALWINKLIHGDNLPVLKTLYDDDTIRGQVRLVYIDPPFATAQTFEARSYWYKPELTHINGQYAYQDSLGDAEYIEFLRKRLVFLRELLAADGSIYVHLDSNMAFAIKTIMDEIFQPRNFRAWITRKKCNPKNYTRNVYGNISDYILFYTKSDTYIWHRPYEKWDEARIRREYPKVETATGRRYKLVPIHAPGVRRGKTGEAWRGMLPPEGKHWQYTPDKLEEFEQRGEIYWSPTGNPRRKVYFDQSQGVPLQDIWLNFRDAHNQMIEVTGYPTEKNLDLLRLLVSTSSNEDDIVLDCFCGSGTTLVAAADLGRRWIGIDESDFACSIAEARFMKFIQPEPEMLQGRFNLEDESTRQQRSYFSFQLLEAGKLPDRPEVDVPRKVIRG
jgi:adenine-specific DNA-methyltransferase